MVNNNSAPLLPEDQDNASVVKSADAGKGEKEILTQTEEVRIDVDQTLMKAPAVAKVNELSLEKNKMVEELTDKLAQFHQSDDFIRLMGMIGNRIETLKDPEIEDLTTDTAEVSGEALVVKRMFQKLLLNFGISPLITQITQKFTLGEQYDLGRELDFSGIREILSGGADPQEYYLANLDLKYFVPEQKPDIQDVAAYAKYKEKLTSKLKDRGCQELLDEDLQQIINILRSDDFYKIANSELRDLTPRALKIDGREILRQHSSITTGNIFGIFRLALKYDKNLVAEELERNLGVAEAALRKKFPNMFRDEK